MYCRRSISCRSSQRARRASSVCTPRWSSSRGIIAMVTCRSDLLHAGASADDDLRYRLALIAQRLGPVADMAGGVENGLHLAIGPQHQHRAVDREQHLGGPGVVVGDLERVRGARRLVEVG